MKKLISLMLVVSGFLGLSAQSSSTSPGNGHWVVIDSGYQVGTTTAGQTVAPLHFYNTGTSEKITGMQGVITSFAGGIVASGSKVGCSNYRFPMPASTNHLWCPGLKDRIPGSLVPDGVTSVYEIVLNGIDEPCIKNAIRTGIRAAAETGAVLAIGASNFDGKLGQYRIHLHELFR